VALEIEDGTAKANGASFVTVDEYKAWATARLFAVPSDAAIEANALKSVDYIKAREPEYGGDRATVTQALPFPRINLTINDVVWSVTDPVTPIPQAVKDFQLGIMKAIADGIDLFPTTAERPLRRQVTGPLEKEWFDANLNPIMPFVEALIQPLRGGSGAFALTVRRI
jgi:hypothetical protein